MDNPAIFDDHTGFCGRAGRHEPALIISAHQGVGAYGDLAVKEKAVVKRVFSLKAGILSELWPL